MLTRIRLLAVAALVAVPSLASAQSAPASTLRSASVAGPRLTTTATAVRRPVQSSARLQTTAAQRRNMGKPVAMMIVGGAAFVAGALIGDAPGTLMMIAGAVIGLIGLYQYLQ
jgi:hypothetical protein